MKKCIIICAYVVSLLFCGTTIHAQQTTFNETFQSLHVMDVTELPDGSFFFTTGTQVFLEPPGLRAWHISAEGVLIDSMTLYTSEQVFTGLSGHQLLLEDNTVISCVVTDSYESTYLVKWRVYPSIEILIQQRIYADSSNAWDMFWPGEIISTNDGNFVAVGYLRGDDKDIRYKGHLSKWDTNLNLLWEVVLPKDTNHLGNDTGQQSAYVLESPQGDFVVSGRTWFDGLFSNGGNNIISKIDSTGTVIWSHVFPILTSMAAEGAPGIVHTSDGHIMMASKRVENCGVPCDNNLQLGRIALRKLDWDGTILKDTLIGPNVWWRDFDNPLRKVPGRGFIISGTRASYAESSRAVNFLISEQGDSLWWHQPYYGDSVDHDHFIYNVKRTLDGGFIGCGLIRKKLMRPNIRENDVGYVYKLDSNGCFGPGNCPTVILSTEEETDIPTELSIYPNPAEDQVTISYNKNLTDALDIHIHDLNGKKVLQHPLFWEENAQKAIIDISHLRSGVYIIGVYNGQVFLEQEKLIVK